MQAMNTQGSEEAQRRGETQHGAFLPRVFFISFIPSWFKQLMVGQVFPVFIFFIPVYTLACTNSNRQHTRISFTNHTAMQSLDSISSFQLRITTGSTSYLALLTNTKTTREFIQMLPLTLMLEDLNGREKYSSLSKELYKEGNVQTSFSAGDICYWLGGGIAIFYNADGHQVKAGLIVIAHLNQGVTEFSKPSSIEVTFEAVKR